MSYVIKPDSQKAAARKREAFFSEEGKRTILLLGMMTVLALLARVALGDAVSNAVALGTRLLATTPRPDLTLPMHLP